MKQVQMNLEYAKDSHTNNSLITNFLVAKWCTKVLILVQTDYVLFSTESGINLHTFTRSFIYFELLMSLSLKGVCNGK